jgi:hypothetical protein
MTALGHSRRMRSTCFSGVCPMLPVSDIYRPKSLAVVKGHDRPFALRKTRAFSSF